MACIYKITSPSGRIYIGQSRNFRQRVSHYKCGHHKDQVKLSRSIVKYGWDAHKSEVICNCTEDILNKMETFFIRYYDSCSSGLNSNYGGDVSFFSEETRKKISEFHKGKKKSIEHAKKARQARIDNGSYKMRPHVLEAIKKANTGRKKSDSEIEAIRERMTGRVVSIDTREKLSRINVKLRGRKILVYNRIGEYLCEFDAIRLACNFLNSHGYNIGRGNVNKCINGDIKSLGGLIFKAA